MDALLGRTRARILAVSTVAEHLAALHAAGLARAPARGPSGHYQRTNLGQALLDASVR